jgi:multiple sugar transport system substrate-binding protein
MSSAVHLEPARLSRRRLLQGGLALGALAGLSGCGSAFASGVAGTPLGSQTLTYWNLFGGGDGARMQTMQQVYAAAHGGPDSLQAATFTWGNPYYTKVALATLGGQPSDVAVAHLTRQKNLARAGLITEITPDMLALVGLKAADFSAAAWNNAKVDDRTYCVPIDTHPFVLYYNRAVCEKAGLLESDGSLKPIRGTKGWEDALRAAKEVTGAYGAAIATVGDQATCWRWYQTLYSQRDGATGWLSDGGARITPNRELSLDTLAWMQSLTASGLMPTTTDYEGSQTLMFTGQAGFYLQGEWEITTAEDIEGLDFGMQPVPQFYDRQVQQADSHTFVLPSKPRTDDQVRRAMEFIKVMVDEGLTWAKGGHVPTYRPILESAAYRELKPQSNYAGAAERVVYDDEAWYSGSGSNFENTLGAQIGLVLQGLATPEQAMGTATDQLTTYANTKSPL